MDEQGTSAEEYIEQEFGPLVKLDDKVEELYELALSMCIKIRRAVDARRDGNSARLRCALDDMREFLDG